jgi:acetyl-CoA synthetase
MNLISKFTRADYSSLNDFYANYSYSMPNNFNFARDVLGEYANRAPGQRALIWMDESGAEREFSFGEINALSLKAANALIQMGVRPGDPVMLMLKRRYEYWILAMALCRLQCIQIPATHQLLKKDIVYRANAADIRAVISVGEEDVLDQIRQALPECGSVVAAAAIGGARAGFIDFDAALAAAHDEFIEPGGVSNDIMLMYFTSGTTGMPKMVAQGFDYPIGHLITGVFWHNLDENCVHLTVADSGWAKSGWGMMYGQWIAGATLFSYDYDKFSAPKMLEALAKHRVTTFCAPPTIFRFLIKEDIANYDLSALKWGCVAGEPLNPEVYGRFYKLTGIKLHEGFGQTETTPIILTPKWMEPRPGSAGKPSPHYLIRLLDEDGRDVEAGEEGEICVDLVWGRPPGLFMGYYRDEARTAEAFAGGVYHTGDMAWRDEEGYYWFIGRGDDVIKSSGYRIGPFEVESALIEHPAVLECAVTGVPDLDRGQVIKATVMLSKGYAPGEQLKKELQQHVKRVTAPYKYPRVIEFVDELPKTISGKIQRKKIKENDIERRLEYRTEDD